MRFYFLCLITLISSIAVGQTIPKSKIIPLLNNEPSTGRYLSNPYQDETLTCYTIIDYKKGKKDGKYFEVCEDSVGEAISLVEGNYKNNEKHGKFTDYYNGRSTGYEEYENGELVKYCRIEINFR